MALPEELRPITKGRVMDLVSTAGIDVSDWPNYRGGATNPGANPKYCYEWALKEPMKVVVCNRWFENMKEIAGSIEQHLHLADTVAHEETNSTRRARRSRMASLLVEAANESLPLRIIVLDRKASDGAKMGKPQVGFRALDPAVWSVVQADPSRSRFVLRRAPPSLPFVDQFEISPPPDGPASTTLTTVAVRSRSREVRLFALRRAKGKCEYCGSAGFSFTDGRVYLETHHVVPLADAGLDSASNVAALCANHHRESHHGANAPEIRRALQELRSGAA